MDRLEVSYGVPTCSDAIGKGTFMPMKKMLIAAIAVAGVATFTAYFIGTSANDVDMPPLPESRLEMYEYYQMEFLPDGYPGRVTEQGLVPHPIYGNYVINDYLNQYRKTGGQEFLDAAIKVGDAAIARMTDLDGALAFQYTPEMALSSLPGTFYSGLTQGRYLQTFTRLAEVSGEQRFKEAAERVLESLTIPVSEGGVLRETHGGAVIEEWPHQMMGDYTLNGWTTAMNLVGEYAEATGSNTAKELLRRNFIALEAILPLYDVPELANTRYRLSGKTWIRVRAEGTDIEFLEGELVIPEEGTFSFETGAESRWQNYVRPDTGPSEIRLNANLNYISSPEPNVLRLVVNAESSGTAVVEVQTGDYGPFANAPVNPRWVEIGGQELEAGQNVMELPIPWEAVPLVAYPTNFRKDFGGKQYNVYHFIHFENLQRLQKFSGDPVLAAYASKWEKYVEKWPEMDIYADQDLVLSRYQSD